MILSAMTDILVHGVFSYFVLVHGITATRYFGVLRSLRLNHTCLFRAGSLSPFNLSTFSLIKTTCDVKPSQYVSVLCLRSFEGHASIGITSLTCHTLMRLPFQQLQLCRGVELLY